MSAVGKRPWALLLFGIPFAAVSVGMLFWALLPALQESHDMKAWAPVPAHVLEVDLEIHQGDGSATYKVAARYRYQYQGVIYHGDRVGLSSGSDNLGDWQQSMAAKLQSARQHGQAITVYVNPAHPAEAIIDREPRWALLLFYGVFVVVFGIVGFGLMIFGWRQISSVAKVDDATPWLSKKEWASPAIVASQTGATWALWGFAIIWCALSAPANIVIVDEVGKGNWAILVIVLFDVVGVGLIVAAIRQTLSARRFGATVLQMDPWPGSIGGQVGGMIAARVPFDEALAFSVKLSCVHTYTSGSGKNSSTHHDPLWQETRWFHAHRANDGMSDLWFCFDVPNHLPASEETSSNYHHWQLQANADIPGIDFERTWELPVFATGKASRDAGRKVRESNEEVMAALEGLMNLRQIPGGISMDYRAGRHWASGLLLIAVGGIFAGVAVFVGQSLSGVGDNVITGVSGLLGSGLLLLGSWQWVNRLQVQIDHSRVLIRYSVLGLSMLTRELALSEVQGITIVRGSRMQKGTDVTQYYSLKVRMRGGARYAIGDGFEGHNQARQAADAIAALTRLPVQADE